MTPFSASMRPRRSASALMAALMPSSLLASSSSSLSTQASTHLKRCFYCPKELPSDSARRRHIESTPKCLEAQRARLQKAIAKKQEAERQRTAPMLSTTTQSGASKASNTLQTMTKKRKVTVETVPDEDDPPQLTPPIPSPQSSTAASQGPISDTSGQPCAPAAGHRKARRMRGYGGLFVEEYPDSLAGSPVSEDRLPPPDLHAHMRSCGNLADPKHFETVELLMTSGLTNAAKDRHLKSSMVSEHTSYTQTC
jgi:hypothetical protein